MMFRSFGIYESIYGNPGILDLNFYFVDLVWFPSTKLNLQLNLFIFMIFFDFNGGILFD